MYYTNPVAVAEGYVRSRSHRKSSSATHQKDREISIYDDFVAGRRLRQLLRALDQLYASTRMV